MNEFLRKLEAFIERGVIPEVEEFSEDHKNLFLELKDLSFIERILKNSSTFEVIFHCGSVIEVLSSNKRTTETIPYPRRFIDLAFKMNALQLKTDWNKKNYQVSYKFSIKQTPVRITLLHKVVQNADHKFFIRKREIQSFPINVFELPVGINFKQKNILISGATGSGKTSLLNSMIQEYYSDQHHVIIEDTRELKINSDLTTYLCSQDRLEEYCAHAMRLSPSNLILGEMRSGEVIPFTLLLTSGHRGLLSTIHANSALDSLERVALLFSLYSRNPMPHEQLLTLLCRNLDYLIFMQDKKISEVIQIKGHKNGRYLYENIGPNALSEAI